MAEGFKLSRAFVEIGADDSSAEDTFRSVKARMYDIGRLRAKTKIDVDDAQGQYKLARFDRAFRKLDQMTAEPGMSAREIDATYLKALRLHAELQRIDRMRVKPDVDAGRGAGGFLAAIPNPLGLGGLPPQVLAGLAAAVAAATPVVALAAAGAITAGAGAAIAAVGVKFATESARIKNQWAGLTAYMGNSLRTISKPFVDVLSGWITTARQVWPKILAPLGQAFSATSGPLKRFGDTLIRTLGDPTITSTISGIGKAFGSLLDALRPVLPSIIDGIGRGIRGIASAIQDHAKQFATLVKFFGEATGKALELVGGLARAGANIITFAGKFVGSQGDLLDVLQHTDNAVGKNAAGWKKFSDQLGKATPGVRDLTREANSLAPAATAIHTGISPLPQALHRWRDKQDEARLALQDTTAAAITARPKIDALAESVAKLATEEKNSLSTQVNFINNLLSTYDAAKQMREALAKSNNTIGNHTQAQRDSFRTAEGYIQNLADTAEAAGKDRRKQDEASDAIRRALPLLLNVKGKTKDYWQEIRTLRNWLNLLQAEKLTGLTISMVGQGKWWDLTGAPGHLLPHHRPGAMGMLVQGGVPGVDSVPILAQAGEVVVPRNLVSAGAVDHLRGQIPGFAQGGIVGSYHGGIGGLQPWAHGNVAAMGSQIVQALLSAMRQAMAAAMASPGFGVSPSGPVQQYARRLLAAYGWGGQFGALNALIMGESGWRWNATNPSSGAYGIPQALPPGKMASAGADWRTNPYTQLRWMFGYLKSVYGSPAAAYDAWVHRIPHWYGKGTMSALPGLAVVGERGPELVKMRGGEQVLPGFAKGGLIDRIHHAERIIRHHPDLGRRWSRLTDSLGAANERLRGDRALARFLHGDDLARLRHRIHDEDRHRRRLLREILPLRHARHVVSSVEGLLHAQEHVLGTAIAAAQRRHQTGVVHRLEKLLHRDKNLADWFGWWLDKRWYTPTKAQRVHDKMHARQILRSAITDLGLPLVSFDRGGMLPTGLTMALNATGRPERVTPARSEPVKVELSFKGSGDHMIDNWLTKHIQGIVRTKGGGDVSTAFGSHY